MRSSGLASVQQVELMKRLSDVFFHPPIEKYSIFDFTQIKVLEVELAAVKVSRDQFQAENSQMKKQLLSYQRQLKKAA